MAIEGASFENSQYYKNAGITSSTVIQGKGASEMDMNDFMSLLVAQMTNQDMMDPVDNTEMVAQMAQFSSLQGIQTLQEYQLSSYAVSYTGKYVTIAHTNDLGGLETINGVVDSVTFYDGAPKVIVNGKSYDLHTVMEVSSTSTSGTMNEAAQYIGKTVTVEIENEYGEMREYSGKVTGITMKDNKPHVIVYNEQYPITAIVNVLEDEETEEVSGEDEE